MVRRSYDLRQLSPRMLEDLHYFSYAGIPAKHLSSRTRARLEERGLVHTVFKNQEPFCQLTAYGRNVKKMLHALEETLGRCV